jgi:hypothetical protein
VDSVWCAPVTLLDLGPSERVSLAGPGAPSGTMPRNQWRESDALDFVG